jgi:16S rRNA (cytidine1402-2'-O)-methyltransferase
MSALADGKNVAVISDAGTPGISDPGYLLFRGAIDAGYEADVLPGPSALLPALILSGLPPHPFLFHGFPPEKPGQRKKLFESLSSLRCTLAFYLSPHKADRHVAEMIEIWGDRRAALVREISKLYQESVRGKLSEILERLLNGVKGEMVLVVDGKEAEEFSRSDSWRDEAEAMLNEGRSVKTIADDIAGRCGAPRNAVKEFLLRLKRTRGL